MMCSYLAKTTSHTDTFPWSLRQNVSLLVLHVVLAGCPVSLKDQSFCFPWCWGYRSVSAFTAFPLFYFVLFCLNMYSKNQTLFFLVLAELEFCDRTISLSYPRVPDNEVWIIYNIYSTLIWQHSFFLHAKSRILKKSIYAYLYHYITIIITLQKISFHSHF